MKAKKIAASNDAKTAAEINSQLPGILKHNQANEKPDDYLIERFEISGLADYLDWQLNEAKSSHFKSEESRGQNDQ